MGPMMPMCPTARLELAAARMARMASGFGLIWTGDLEKLGLRAGEE